MRSALSSTSCLAIVLATLAVAASCSESGNGGAEPDTAADTRSDAPADPDADDAADDGGDAGLVVPDGFDVQGHRGARGLKPENTLPAFEVALDLGVSTLELDLHLTRDDVLVIWHDPAIDAAKCGLDPNAEEPLPPDPDDSATPAEDLMIRQLTAEQLARYRCDRNPDPEEFPEQDNAPTVLAGDAYHIATLVELLDLVEAYAGDERKTDAQRQGAARVGFNLETKRDPDHPEEIGDGFNGVDPGPFERAVVELLQERGLVERAMLQSFDHRSLRAAHTLDEDLRLVALTQLQAPASADWASDGFSVWSPLYLAVLEERLDDVHAAGLQVIPWTVNAEDDMRRLIALGVDGLITDRPDLLLEVVRGE